MVRLDKHITLFVILQFKFFFSCIASALTVYFRVDIYIQKFYYKQQLIDLTILMGFSGGYRFKHFEGPAEPVLTTLGLPDTVVYPISDGFTVTVAQDDTVSAGTPVLRHPERTGMMVLFISKRHG